MMVDLNAKVGAGHTSEVCGNFGLGERNDAGLRLVDFCLANDLVITNTLFQHHPRRLYTLTSPNGITKKQIDYICIRNRWRSTCKNAKTFPGADCGTDHQLLVAQLQIKLKAQKSNTHVLQYDLANIPDTYRVEVNNRFEELLYVEEEQLPEEIWCQIKEAILSAAESTIPKVKGNAAKFCLSLQTLLMVEERRKLKAAGADHATLKDLTLVFSIVLYGAEAWTLKTGSGKRIDAFEMWSWHRMLSIH